MAAAATKSTRAEIDGLREDVRTLIVLVKQLMEPKKTPYQKRIEIRDTNICQLAYGVGPVSQRTAEEVWAIIDEQQGHDPPAGYEHIAKLLQNNSEANIGKDRIYKIILLGNL